ncbi:MAG: hypothetical protein KF819_19840 [Labilithrix sp.]|nr:hypothetical protein [Labilithrix sp.]
MVNRQLQRSVVFVASLAVLLAATRAHADCKNDVECKGDRICEKGRCVSPPPATALPPPAAPPPASAPVPPPEVAPAPPPVASTPSRRSPAARARPEERDEEGRAEGARDERDEEARVDGERRPNWLLVGLGTGLLATAWFATGVTVAAICGDIKCRNSEEGVVWIPLFGPPVVAAVGKPSGGQVAALTASFLAQSAGLTLLIVGLATNGPAKSKESARSSVYVAPQLGGASGLIVGGAF